jgi:hypothetical protein
MAFDPRDAEKAARQGVIPDYFQDIVRTLLSDNIEMVVTAALDRRRNVEALHFIDPNPQPERELGYHIVYESFDTEHQIATRGLYLANIWPRTRHSGPNGRHYFSSSRELIVREDIHGRKDIHHEFLRPRIKMPGVQAEDDIHESMLATDFIEDINRLRASEITKPLSIVFNMFPRPK